VAGKTCRGCFLYATVVAIHGQLKRRA